MPDFVVVARITLGLIFLTSSFSKIRAPTLLVQAIEQYVDGRIPSNLARLLARLLPPFELLLGLLFLSGLWLPMAAFAALVALFSGAK